MAAHHLRVHVGAHVVDVELARICGDLAVQHHLQKHVAQLFAQMHHVARLDGVNGLVGFLDHVVRDALVRLLAIPRTAVRRAQRRDGGDELVERRMVDRMRRAMEALATSGRATEAEAGSATVGAAAVSAVVTAAAVVAVSVTAAAAFPSTAPGLGETELSMEVPFFDCSASV